jgi:hypothetical protein
MKSSSHARILFLCLGIVFVVSPVFSRRLDPNGYAGGRSRDAGDRLQRNASSIGLMLGDLRTGISDIMFVKTERYLDSGVVYEPHMSEELLSVSETMDGMDSHQASVGAEKAESGGEAEHVGVATLIRSEVDDFRGWIGKMERQVKPYTAPGEGHSHTDGRELLPWFRVMTLTDPNYVSGYATGAWWLRSRNAGEALAFAEEGIGINPNAFQIHLVKAQILLRMARSTGKDIYNPDDEVLPLLNRARAAFNESADLALSQRPEDADPENPTEDWSRYQELDAWGAARMSALMEWQYGNSPDAAELARKYTAIFGEDRTLQRIIDSHPRD